MDHTPARDPATLRDARLQLHWAAQPVAAAAEAILGRRDDDGQSNLGFDGEHDALVTHPLPDGWALGVRLGEPALLALHHHEVADAMPLPGRTLSDALGWVRDREPGRGHGPIELRDYDMPEHPFADGSPFDASDADAFRAVAGWVRVGYRVLEAAAASHEHTTPRLWPHHFDVGSILPLAGDPQELPSVGIGFEPGDASVEQVYYYVNPYPEGDPPDEADRPAPPDGFDWADGRYGFTMLGVADRPVVEVVEKMRGAIGLAMKLASG